MLCLHHARHIPLTSYSPELDLDLTESDVLSLRKKHVKLDEHLRHPAACAARPLRCVCASAPRNAYRELPKGGFCVDERRRSIPNLSSAGTKRPYLSRLPVSAIDQRKPPQAATRPLRHVPDLTVLISYGRDRDVRKLILNGIEVLQQRALALIDIQKPFIALVIFC